MYSPFWKNSQKKQNLLADCFLFLASVFALLQTEGKVIACSLKSGTLFQIRARRIVRWDMYKKIVALLFLLIVLVVGVQTMARTGYSLGTSLFSRLTTVLAKTGWGHPNPSNHNGLDGINGTQRKNEGGSFFASVKRGIEDLESRFDDNFTCRSSFIDLYGLVQLFLDKKVIDSADPFNTVILDSHHRLYLFKFKVETKELADAVIDFHSFVANQNIPLLYVQVPPKENPHSNDMPTGVLALDNTLIDSMLERLQEQQVPTLDLRSEILKDKLDWYSLHYRTDHHWTMETAFWAHAKVIEKLNAEYNIGMDSDATHRNMQNYDKIFLPRFFLGSAGRHVGQYFIGIDDFSYFVPRFDTHLGVSREGSTGTKTKTGTFGETIIDSYAIQVPAPLARNRYAVYFGGDSPLVQICNTQGNGRILIIQDSHGLPFSAFLALSAQELDIVDLRHFIGSIREFVSQKHYDTILILYGPIVSDSRFRDLAERLYE